MPKYKVSFEYETEVEADNEEDAIFNCSTIICEYMGDNAIVEEIEVDRHECASGLLNEITKWEKGEMDDGQ